MRFLRCVFGFLLGLSVVALLLYGLLPRDDEDLDGALARAKRCQVLLVGPSYIRSGFLPDVFERETQALGHPLRACKFSRSALRGYEVEHDLGILMRHRWPALKKVLVDVTLAPTIGFERDNWFTPRMVHWHTWQALTWLRRYYGRRDASVAQRAPLWLAHLQHVTMNYLSVGRVGSRLTQARRLERVTGRDRRYKPPKDVDRPQREVDTFETLAKKSRQLAADKAKDRERRRYEDDTWPRELEPVIRDHGYEPVFLYSPVLIELLPPQPVRAGKRPLVFMDFADPDRYPSLYEPEVRARGSHLTTEGAQRYSRLLARQVLALATEPEEREGIERSAPRVKRSKNDRKGKRKEADTR